MNRIKVLTWVLLFALAMACTAAGQVIYVDAYATGANDGSSWENAYKYLRDALGDATSAPKPLEIWVAEGIYTPDSNSAEPNGTRDREATFHLIDDVAVYGGFPRGGSWEQRDPNMYESILSGDLSGDDPTVSKPADLLNEPNRAENSYHVVTRSWTDANAVVDGFTITGGNANGAGFPRNLGAGIYSEAGSVAIANCLFRDNSAADIGGGIYSNNYTNSTITDCNFTGNFADRGAGMFNGGTSTATLGGCTFAGNRAASRGAGIWNASSVATLTDCNFTENSTGSYAGGVYNSDGNASLTNCRFTGNSAWVGGGMHSFGGSSLLSECVFTQNSAGDDGGGIHTDSGSAVVSECVFTENSTDQSGGGMYNSSGSVMLIECLFTNNSAKYGGGGVAAAGEQNLLNCKFIGNTAPRSSGGGIYIMGTSATLTNCLFSGNSGGGHGGATYISATGAEVTNCAFSANSATYQGGGIYAKQDASITNCIFWGNSDEGGIDESAQIHGATHVNYSDVQGGWTGAGTGNIYADPKFVDADGLDDIPGTQDDDLHLLAGSPCIDAGSPCTPVNQEPSPNGCRVNMGFFGGTAEATESPILECFPSTYSTYSDWKALGEPCCWCWWPYQCDGDADCDTETVLEYRIYGKDLGLIVDNWKRKIDDPLLDPCADIDHKAETILKFRVYGRDLAKIVENWKKTDTDLAGNCPRPE